MIKFPKLIINLENLWNFKKLWNNVVSSSNEKKKR